MRRLLLGLALLMTLTGCGSSSSSVPVPNAVAVGFLQDMSVHHEQAILMSQLALTHGTPAIRAIALSILSSQSEDVGAMRGWLKLWGRSAIDPHPMGWMMGSSMSSSMAMPSAPSLGSTWMPGMATSAELVRLYQSTGRGFDVLFLQLMIRHHLAGVAMARAAITGHATSLVAAAAQQMIASQVEEVGSMRAILATDGGHELAPARL